MILLRSLQIGLLTPPFGLLLFVMKGVCPPEISTRQVWAAAAPYVVIVFAVLLLVVFVPSVATLLVKVSFVERDARVLPDNRLALVNYVNRVHYAGPYVVHEVGNV